jgi:hypothetical protein
MEEKVLCILCGAEMVMVGVATNPDDSLYTCVKCNPGSDKDRYEWKK